MTFVNFYKRYGIRKTPNLTKPIIVKADTVKFPIQSAIYHMSNPELPALPKALHGYLTKQIKTSVFTIGDYHNPVGELKRLSTKTDSEVRKLKALDENHKYIFSRTKLLLTPPSTMLILNYSTLYSLYRYKNKRGVEYDINYNSISTMCEDVSNDILSTRVKYIPISIPSKFPKVKDFEKSLRLSNKRILNTFENFDLLTIFQLYKWLSPEHAVSSPFNKLDKNNLDNIVFMFKFGNSVSFIKASNLRGLVKDYKMDTTMSPLSSKSARKLFLYYLINNVIVPPVDSDKVDKLVPIYAKATIEVNEDNIDDILDDIDEKIDGDSDDLPEEVIDAVLPDLDVPDVDELLNATETTYGTITKSLNDKVAAGTINDKEYTRQLNILTEQESSGVLKNNVVTKEDIAISNDDNMIPDSEVILDKSMLVDTIKTFDSKYIEKVMKKDTINTLYSLQNTGLLIKDHETVDHTNFLGSNTEHIMTIQPPNGRATTLKVVLPNVEPNGTFKSAGYTYTMRKQKTDVPIKKISPTSVALSSYYGKVFITKATYKKNDVGYAISKQLHKMNIGEEHNLKLLVLGEQSVIGKHLPVVYSQISRYVKSFTLKGVRYIFTYNNRDSLLLKDNKLSDIEKDGKVLIGRKGNVYYLIDKDNRLVTFEKSYEVKDSLIKELGIDIQILPIEFSAIGIMKSKIPLVLVLSYYMGLNKLIKSLKAKVTVLDRGKRYQLEDNEYRVNFKDVSYILNRNDELATMILAGLLDLKDEISNMDSSRLNDKDGILSIATAKEYSRRHITEIRLYETMFIDPMTKQLLEEMKEPTTWIGLLLRSNELLLTDFAKHPRELDGMVVKGFERINGMLYKELVTTIKSYENNHGIVQTKLSMNPYSVLTALQTDSTTMLVEDLNPIAMLKQKEEITSLGAGGRNKETMSKETRGHHSSEVGVISEAGKDSSDVGITNYLSSAPNITSIRGLAGGVDDKETMKPSSILSTTATILPASTKDDQKI